MDEVLQFFTQVGRNIKALGKDRAVQGLSNIWMRETARYNYSYNFTWLGRPIIQYPQDIIALQEVIWQVKPELIVETGIAHGGSLIFYASILELIGKGGQVLGIDINIRSHNRVAIEQHALFKRVTMLEGSSVDSKVLKQVRQFAEGKKPVMVILDSNHTHAHVLQELELYSPLVTKDSYLVVCDTLIEDLPEEFFPDRPWTRGNNPKTAVATFLNSNDRFVVEEDIENKLLITVAPSGYLKCVKV